MGVIITTSSKCILEAEWWLCVKCTQLLLKVVLEGITGDRNDKRQLLSLSLRPSEGLPIHHRSQQLGFGMPRLGQSQPAWILPTAKQSWSPHHPHPMRMAQEICSTPALTKFLPSHPLQ